MLGKKASPIAVVCGVVGHVAGRTPLIKRIATGTSPTGRGLKCDGNVGASHPLHGFRNAPRPPPAVRNMAIRKKLATEFDRQPVDVVQEEPEGLQADRQGGDHRDRRASAIMMASSAAAISSRRLVEVYFDFPLGGFKNFNVTRADSTRDDNCRFPQGKEMLTC
jgi:hypothetical protein